MTLWHGYRATLKANWSQYYWPVRALVDLAGQINNLPVGVQALLKEFEGAETLPRPVAEYADALDPLAARWPELIRRCEDVDSRLGRAIMGTVPRPDVVDRIKGNCLNLANELVHLLESIGVDPARARVLEVGCGAGFMAMAITRLGVGSQTGGVEAIDLEFPVDKMVALEPSIRAAILEGIPEDLRPKIRHGNVCAMDAADDTYDLIYSYSVFEHIADIWPAFREIARVLKPGGISYHNVDPWLGPSGGHSICSLDSPWGHALLGEADFEAYLREFRPHEADYAMAFYRGGFQQPRRPLAGLVDAAACAGLRIYACDLNTSRFQRSHTQLIDHELLSAVRQKFPGTGYHDLITSGIRLIVGGRPIARQS